MRAVQFLENGKHVEFLHINLNSYPMLQYLQRWTVLHYSCCSGITMDLIWIKLWSFYTLLCLVFKWLALFSEQHSKQIEADA